MLHVHDMAATFSSFFDTGNTALHVTRCIFYQGYIASCSRCEHDPLLSKTGYKQNISFCETNSLSLDTSNVQQPGQAPRTRQAQGTAATSSRLKGRYIEARKSVCLHAHPNRPKTPIIKKYQRDSKRLSKPSQVRGRLIEHDIQGKR